MRRDDLSSRGVLSAVCVCVCVCVSVCDLETSTMRRPRPTRAAAPRTKMQDHSMHDEVQTAVRLHCAMPVNLRCEFVLYRVAGYLNLLNTKRNLLYIRNQSVPRSKHFPPQL